MASESTVHEIPPEVLALVPLPDVEEMTDDQTRGRTCVWGGEQLHGGTAIDLGERLEPMAGSSSLNGVRLFLRGCPACTHQQAHRALLDHASACEQCVDDATQCDIGRGLNRLMRQARRS